MSQAVRAVAALLVSVALMWFANGLFFSLIGLRMVAEGFDTSTAGAITSMYFAGQFVGALFLGRVIEQVGHVRAFAAFASVVSAASLGHAIIVEPMFWAGLRFVHGMCVAGALMVAESWLNGSTANESRGRLLAIYTALVYLSMGSGQQLLNLYDPSDFVLFSLASILFSLALIPLILARSATAGEVAPSRLSLRRLFDISPLGLVGSFAAGILTGVLFGMMPIYWAQSGLATSEIATFMMVAVFGGLVLQYPVGKISDLFDRRTVILGTTLASGGVAFLMSLIDDTGGSTMLALVAVFGGLIFSIYPLAVSHANDYIDPSDLVSASAGLVMSGAFGAAIGPIAGAYAMELMGPSGLFQFCAGTCLVLGAFILYRMTARAAPLAEDQGPYAFTPRMTPAGAELDPRAEYDDEEVEEEIGLAEEDISGEEASVA